MNRPEEKVPSFTDIEQGVDFLHTALTGYVVERDITPNELLAIVSCFLLRQTTALISAGADAAAVRHVVEQLTVSFDMALESLAQTKGELPELDGTRDVEFYDGKVLPKMPDSKN
jgi:hypothetical protein